MLNITVKKNMRGSQTTAKLSPRGQRRKKKQTKFDLSCSFHPLFLYYHRPFSFHTQRYRVLLECFMCIAAPSPDSASFICWR